MKISVLCQDNDDAGNAQAAKISALAQGKFLRKVPSKGKDWNECLAHKQKVTKS